MDIFKHPNFDFLGNKWPFIIASLLLTGAGIVSLIAKGGPRYGIDFKGGANMYVKFASEPPEDKIRAALSAKIPGEISIQRITSGTSRNEVIINTELTNEQALNENRQRMQETLMATFAPSDGKEEFNNAGVGTLVNRLRTPLQAASVPLNDEQLVALVRSMTQFRDKERSGLLTSFDELSGVAGVTPQVISVLKQQCSVAPFVIRQTEVVGPKVGADLRKQALYATLAALAGMLIYIAFRFEWIYGLAAVIAVFHDTIITIGLFSLVNKEITLTVIAALLTLVGYSMNDTIVVFDRIRENLRTMRKESFQSLVNLSVNQTLNRTLLTSGLTLLTALALWIFGGQVLDGFSFALVVGIIVGTFSSVFIASPILIFWHNWAEGRKARSGAASASAALKEPAAKKLAGGRAVQ